jgi:hypothetical protein
VILENLWQNVWFLVQKLWPLIIIAIVVKTLLSYLVFTRVDESTAKAFVRKGEVTKIAMVWKGHRLDRGNVVEEDDEEWHPLGGLRFVGFRGLDEVYRYRMRWRDLQLIDGGERSEFHDKILDYILVRPDVYFTDIEKAETKPPERIPLDIQFLITIRVINPFKALFDAPPNWNENVMMRLNALFRDWVGIKTMDEILELREEPEKMWEEFENDPLLSLFNDEWGIKIEAIQIRDVGLAPGYEEPAAMEKLMELKAKGVAAETIGTVVEMLARARGKEVDEINKEIDEDEELKKEFMKISHDLIIRKLGIEGGAYADIRVQGAEGIERTILNALALWQRMPKGKRKIETKQNERTNITEEDIKKAEEDLERAIDEIYPE